MGASVNGYWPGITDEQLEAQPGFYNDCKAWGNWMAELESVPEVEKALKRLNAGALMTVKTDGWDDDDVMWVSPAELRDAAQKLREAVQIGKADTKIIVATYSRNANGIDPVADEFTRDLDDIIELANYAEAQGVKKMTLEVNW